MKNKLTKQYHKGTLPSGFYYFKNKTGDTYTVDYHSLAVKESKDVEVLSEIPSFEEYEKLKKQLEIATKTLKSIKRTIDDFEDDPMNKIEFMAYGNLWSVRDRAKESLKQIKELDK